MSTNCYNCYKIPAGMAKPEKLMGVLNTMRVDYLRFLEAKITPATVKDAVDLVENDIKKGRRAPEWADIPIGGTSYFRKFLLMQSGTMERGMDFDCSGNCVVVQHHGTVLWFFPGYELEQFLHGYAPLKKWKNYSWSDQCDGFPENISKFWETLFEERKEAIPANLGLSFEFWRADWDSIGFANKFARIYKTLE